MPNMPLKEQFLLLCEKYRAHHGMKRSYLSTLMMNGGHVLDRIADPKGDLKTRSFEKSVQWLSDNWPDELAWPREIARPKRSKAAA